MALAKLLTVLLSKIELEATLVDHMLISAGLKKQTTLFNIYYN